MPLARDLGLEHVWIVANKVRTARDEAAIREFCDRRRFEIVASIPFDERVTEADQQGRSLIDVAPNSAAVAAVGTVADLLVDHFTSAIGSARR